MRLLTLFIVLISAPLFSQCPEGDVLLTSQQEIIDFVTDYPDCSQIAGDLGISTTSENLDLSLLSNLEVVEGELRIGGLTEAIVQDIDSLPPGSLTGLENISSVGDLILSGSYFSLEPLTNISGEIGFMYFNGMQMIGPCPDFAEVSEIGSFAWDHCSFVTESPRFSGLQSIGPMEFYYNGAYWIQDSLRVIHIPTPVLNSEELYITISGLEYLESILGDGELTNLGRFTLQYSPNLVNLSAFENVTKVEQIHISANNAGAFNGFHNLEEAEKIHLEVNEYFEPQYIDELTVPIGMNSDELKITEYGLNIRLDQVGTFDFPANTPILSSLNIRADEVDVILGFTELDSIVGPLSLSGPGLSESLRIWIVQLQEMPAFTNLKYIKGALNFIYNWPDEFSLLTPTSFPLLNHIGGGLGYSSGQNSTTVSSLNHFPSLEYLGGIHISNVSGELDMSSLQQTEGLRHFKLTDAGSFEQELVFENTTELTELRIYNTDLTTVPQFPNVSSIGEFKIFQNSTIEVLSGLPSLTHIEELNVGLNPLLISIDLPQVDDIDELSFGGNPSLMACDTTPSLCRIILAANSLSLINNGEGCNDENAVVSACTVLGSEDAEFASFNAWIDFNGNLIVESKDLDISDIRLYDTSGRIVFERNNVHLKNRTSISLPHQTAGVYLFQVASAKGVSAKKLLIN
ncbi:T9SS type A sorting domain-containing protein [Cryomorphaceae bacterium 1068]|nr:T9SS type A sorting domain-containing protein [Cryomorphaceae bacterium 1068]